MKAEIQKQDKKPFSAAASLSPILSHNAVRQKHIILAKLTSEVKVVFFLFCFFVALAQVQSRKLTVQY